MNEQMTNDLNVAMEINESNYWKYTALCEDAFLSMLGLMIDNWSAVNDGDSIAMARRLAEAVKQVNSELGRMEVTS